MDSLEAKAEIFYLAFKSMTKSEKELIIKKLYNDAEFKEDIIDLVLIEQRKDEPSYSFEEYLKKNDL